MPDRLPRVHPHHHADTGTWSYVVADPATRDAAIIDPVLDFDARSGRTSTASVQALLDTVHTHGYRVRWLLETHAHADHLSAAHGLRGQLPDATLAIGAGIRAVQAHFAPLLDPDGTWAADGSPFGRLFADDDTFAIGAIDARAIPVPGHTRDSLAYLIGDALFTGDSLFMPDAGTARCDFPGGDAATLYRSIRRLYDTLPGATRVPRWITGMHDSVAMRVSAHPGVVALCETCGGALVSTSANRTGTPPPRALDAFDPALLAALDGMVEGETQGLTRPTPIRDARSGKVLRD